MSPIRQQSMATAQRQRRRERSSTGFTLVELLAVLAIMALLLAVTMPAFLAMGKGSKFDVAISELRATLNQARQWAITHRVDTYVVFPDDRSSLYSGPELKSYALRSYNAYTEADGYVREWTFLPPGLFFVNKNGYKGSVTNTVWVFDDDDKPMPFPESSSGTKEIPYIGFKPDGTRMGSGFTRILYLGEGIADGSGFDVTYLPETNAPLFGLEVSQLTGGVRVRDYQDQ